MLLFSLFLCLCDCPEFKLYVCKYDWNNSNWKKFCQFCVDICCSCNVFYARDTYRHWILVNVYLIKITINKCTIDSWLFFHLCRSGLIFTPQCISSILEKSKNFMSFIFLYDTIYTIICDCYYLWNLTNAACHVIIQHSSSALTHVLGLNMYL